MKKNNKNNLLRISFFVSIVLHVIAIASVNHIEIRSYLSSGNISFSNKTDLFSKKKKSKEIMNIVLKQKQKELQQFLEKNPIIILPDKESNKNIINEFSCSNVPALKNEFNFQLPTLSVHNNFANNGNNRPIIQIENETPDYTTFKIVEHQTNPLDEPNAEFENFLSKVVRDLPGFEVETPKYLIPSVGMNNHIALSLNDIKNSSILPKSECEQNYSVSIANELYTKVEELFKFRELIDNEETLVSDYTKFKQNDASFITQNFSLIDMPNLEDLTTLPYKDYFDVEVSFAPKINEKGYIFAITFVPKPTIKLNRLKQNVFFLVDRSNSIQKERLNSTRHAITSSIPFLNEEDTFNILAFDSKLDVLSTLNLKNDNISLSRARSFLRRQNIGSFFSSTNFTIPLYKILDKNIGDDEINIAILISNGDGLHKFKNSRVLNDWSRSNGGNLSLYTLCLENDKNMSVLELFSSLNKGKLLSADSTKNLRRKLQRLIKSISSPIAKDIVANAICLDNKAKIKLYPSNSQAPNLYINEPYTLLGTIEKLEDFTIFLQGKCKNNTFNLKKHISFDEAKQGGSTLQKELAMKLASICYQRYLVDNKSNHLQEAQKHLKPFEIEPIFK